LYPRLLSEPRDDVSYTLGRQTPAGSVQEEGRTVSLDKQSGLQVPSLDSYSFLVHDDSQPMPATFTLYPKEGLGHAKIFDVEGRHLPHAQPGRKNQIYQR